MVGLSANNVVRLKQVWEQEFQAWSKRDLHGKRYVYLWADAVYFNVRLQKEHSFLAVADGALGFWKALEEALPGARAQQCWVHKTANVLDKLSQRVRP